MTKDDIALIILHALMSNSSETTLRSMSDVFDIADAFIKEREIRNDSEKRSPRD